MTKRPLCLGAAGVLSGILAAAYGWSVFARALLACGVLACGILGGIFADGYRPGDGISTAERKRMAFGAGVFLLMFALGSGRYLEAEESRQAYLGELQDGMYVTVQGQLAGKQIQKNRYVYELTSCMFRTDSSNFLQAEPVSCGGVLIYSDSDDCSIGDILIYHGEITLWKRASNEGAFDAKAYYFARGFDFAMEGPALDRKVCAKRQTAEALWQLGQRIKEVYLKTMGERDAGILATMVVGDREFLDAETKRLYQIGGLSHILAISGLHISVIGMALYRMLKKAGLPFGMAALAAAGVMYGYGGMAGWGVSVRRAVLMFLLFLGAQVSGRSYDTFCALAFAAVALLWKNPCTLIVGKNHRFASMDKVRVEDLRNETFVIWNRSNLGTNKDLIDICKPHGFLPNFGAEAFNDMGVLSAVAMGEGIASLPLSQNLPFPSTPPSREKVVSKRPQAFRNYK